MAGSKVCGRLLPSGKGFRGYPHFAGTVRDIAVGSGIEALQHTVASSYRIASGWADICGKVGLGAAFATGHAHLGHSDPGFTRTLTEAGDCRADCP